MNKRQLKKWVKKVKVFCSLEDVYCKCFKCQNFECGDRSVGLEDGCVAEVLYDNNGNIIKNIDDKICEHMDLKGFTCPYFLKMKGKDVRDNLPKTYKEYRTRLTALNKMYEKEWKTILKNCTTSVFLEKER